MIDFTIRVKNLPHHTLYDDKDDVLRAMLTAHFEELIKDEMKLLENEDKDKDEDDLDFTNLNAIDPNKANKDVDPQLYEVADINFGKADMSDMELISKMSTF